ncbi:hypothetical protein COCC4DRAFT_72299 [Bipolaris maydis ATCC 48331]|uniref:Transmembrane protein 135 N-terminal domain-containing protein n=3 Tax=Cochliobolus heterostrophus TaxID=5016 RepID=M2UM99_COCH5|nr:uncharacterized protein COCC4DRAFT_72299 [Bipolaris maydis ATCC 48331]EMD89067.1 hypothetical protein COCHEDRAFT_1196015 [Bipolaris maydis C5]KAH7552449.1 hypothetical protein BM1_08400 [Bipolaris maydis]ENI05213.1 hypothetical protein COCC4DRAFT_72299 [Bipolaris maydis ATCC 48331]KAJ5056953.1 hypothetical protein J3E74DRAFT_277735 [Bipolaris maydis]KAJ6212440.1 hypothetical protein PSV09DRAFT_1196015 [Bipolaris maydis]
MSSSASASQPPPPGKPQPIDPILRNALRYTISAKEYQLLHQYLLSRAPAVKKRSITPKRYDAIVKGPDDYNVAAFRAALRLGLVTLTGLKAWEVIKTRFLSRRAVQRNQPRVPIWKSPNVRLSSSLALILLFHRLLRRVFLRIRESLLSNEARSFRRRNPRISRTLTSTLAPAIGSSLAGFFLAVYPGDQLRITMAIYVMTRALEFGYNYLEELGYMKNRPSWFGSWMLMPVACGQLLHAFVFDRDCFPSGFGEHILRNSPEYIQKRPADYPKSAPWPGTFDIVDSLAEISRQRWPPFISPILFPDTETLPKRLGSISPITSSAHPAIKSLSCALLHPQDPSCLRTYIQYWIQAFPKIARLFTIFFATLSIRKYKAFLSSPLASLNTLAKSILRMSIFLSGAIGTSWGSICLFTNFLPRSFLATQRWFLSGVLGGMWGFLGRRNGRMNFLYTARMSLDSLWKVGVKHGWWTGVKNGDVLLFVASLALVNTLYEVSPRSVNSGVARKGLGVLRGEGWVDRAVVGRDENEKKKKREE